MVGTMSDYERILGEPENDGTGIITTEDVVRNDITPEEIVAHIRGT